MRITPLDVRKQEFKRGMRGYDSDEVRAFLSTLADEYEAVLVDNKQLRERVLEQDEKLAEYRNLEKTLRDTLMTAERVTQEARDTARKEGELVLKEAHQKVDRVLAEGHTRLNELRREALAVHREKETYLGRFRNLAEAQIHFVEQHHSDFVDLDGRLLDQAGSIADHQTSTPRASVDQNVNVDESITTPAARLDNVKDEWREYSVKEDEAQDANAGEVEHIADVVQEAEKSLEVKPQAETKDEVKVEVAAETKPQPEEAPRV